MYKICILQTEWANEKVLRHYSKMTPGRRGIWKDMVGVTSINEADVVAIVDYTTQDIGKKPAVYLGAHPMGMNGYRCFDNAKNVIAKYDLRDTFGFGEWWLDEDYDTLSALDNPVKTKNLSCILSDKTINLGHRQRISYVERFCSEYPKRLDLYGRINPKIDSVMYSSYRGILGIDRRNPEYAEKFNSGKTKALLPYQYTLEFDDEWDSPCYFSERVFDDLLLWCMPIYSGGLDINKFLPKNSIIPFNRVTTDPKELIEIIDSGFREKHIEDVREARHLLLNKYQIWARVYEGITGHV